MSTMAEVIAAHTADWTDWATSETDHEHYRCLCGLVEWHVNSSIDYHQAHAEHVADALTKAGYGKLADAWDEGHRTYVQREMDDCRCGAYYKGECGCGKYGTGKIITPNPYRTEP